MVKGLYDLARLIKLMAVDVAKESSYWKFEKVSVALGLRETDEFFDEVRVTDDSGYRDIIIGDARGNVSRVNGRRVAAEEHKGYMLLYREDAPFHYKCFPSVREIYERLIIVTKEQILTDEFAWYARKDKDALSYYAKVVAEHVDALEKLGKSPKEIFDSCQ